MVGLLNETESFYEMIAARVRYLNMDKRLAGRKNHQSGVRFSKDYAEGIEMFTDPEFQRRVLQENPAFAALHRLYLVAVEVNRFQQRELASCAVL